MVPPVPKVSRGSLTVTVAPQVAGSRTTRIKFDTAVLAGQFVRLPFRATGLGLIDPAPLNDHVATGPDAWRFDDGQVIVHEITDDGFSVEVQPNDLVVQVEMVAYGSPG
jgi:hypothetical protein